MLNLSIIVPIYKTEKYIDACIQSILQQTYQDFELILVDDGSPDNCGKICDEYAEKDSRIRVIHKENGGQSSARNVALNIAQGSIIGFVDSDDIIDSNMYEKLIAFLDANDLDIACCDVYVEYPHKTKVNFKYSTDKIFGGKEALCENLKGNIDNSVWNKVYRRELFDNLRFEEEVVFEDVRILPLLLLKAGNTGYLRRTLYHYYKRKNSTTNTSFSSKARYDHFVGYKRRFDLAITMQLPCVEECRRHAIETALAAMTAFYANNEDALSSRWKEVNSFVEQNLDTEAISKLRKKHKFLLWSFKYCKVLHRIYAKLSGLSKQ